MALAAMLAMPAILARQAPGPATAAPPEAAADAKTPPAADRTASGALTGAPREHGHELPLSAPHWYVTMHGEQGALSQVYALDGTGAVLGPVLGALPAGEAPLDELRGMVVFGDGQLAVISAKSASSRAILFGAPDARTGVRAFRSVLIRRGGSNPAFVHPYQLAVGPEGALYASNQDTNTITRYEGMGSWFRGSPMQVPSGLSGFGTLLPGTVVPNDQQSPEGINQARGFAFGPDGLLYACDRGRGRIAAYDPRTGRLVRVVADAQAGIGHPIQLVFSRDGQHMLVTDNKHNGVWRIDIATGRVHSLVRPGSGGLDGPSAIAERGDFLYVGSRLGKRILKYDRHDGRFRGVFAELPSNPEFMVPVTQQ
jgi:DNA-binding beta-propeller fold protein YncE